MDNPKDEARKFLQSNSLAVISTVTPDGEPQAATIFYTMDDDFNFYFVTRRHSRKYANLTNNNRVAITVTSTENGPETVQIQGETESSFKDLYEFVAVFGKKVDLFNLYYGPFLKLAGLDFQVFKVKVHWLRFLNLQEGADAYRQIIPDYSLVEENKK